MIDMTGAELVTMPLTSGDCGDIHICGKCRATFSDIESFLAHRQQEEASHCVEPVLHVTSHHSPSSSVTRNFIQFHSHVDIQQDQPHASQPRQHDISKEPAEGTLELHSAGAHGPSNWRSAKETCPAAVPQPATLSTDVPWTVQTTVDSTCISSAAACHANAAAAVVSTPLTGQTESASKKHGPKEVSAVFKCSHPGCSFAGRYKKDLQRHSRIHTGEKPYKCPECLKEFSRSDKMKSHQRKHTGEKPFTCSQCDYAAADSWTLKMHQRVHTDDKPYRCQMCNFAGRHQNQLLVHLRMHTGDTPFPCPQCSARFRISCDLQRHLRTHTGERPYACLQCPYKASVLSNLRSHERAMHSADQPARCNQCSFSCSSKRELRLHNTTHREGSLRCSECSYTCERRSSLTSHMRSHDKTRPYHCQACNYTSKHPANLRSHMKNKHSKKPSKPRKGVVKRCQAVSCHRTYQCSECPEAFVREDSLRSHCRLHLKGILPPAALPQASEEAAQVTSESLDTVAEGSTILQPSRENCNEQEIDPACLVPALSTATFTVCTASEQVQPLCQPQVDSMGTSQILECLVQDPVTVEFLPDKQLVFLASGQDSTSASTTNLPLLVSALQPAFWASPPVAPLENST
nr:zinc finger protein 64-like [Rhipicephalus microplus]